MDDKPKAKVEFERISSHKDLDWPGLHQFLEENNYRTVVDLEETGNFNIACYKVNFDSNFYVDPQYLEVDARFEHQLHTDKFRKFLVEDKRPAPFYARFVLRQKINNCI